jgi:hypothetical protein
MYVPDTMTVKELKAILDKYPDSSTVELCVSAYTNHFGETFEESELNVYHNSKNNTIMKAEC